MKLPRITLALVLSIVALTGCVRVRHGGDGRGDHHEEHHDEHHDDHRR